MRFPCTTSIFYSVLPSEFWGFHLFLTYLQIKQKIKQRKPSSTHHLKHYHPRIQNLIPTWNPPSKPFLSFHRENGRFDRPPSIFPQSNAKDPTFHQEIKNPDAKIYLRPHISKKNSSLFFLPMNKKSPLSVPQITGYSAGSKNEKIWIWSKSQTQKANRTKKRKTQ